MKRLLGIAFLSAAIGCSEAGAPPATPPAATSATSTPTANPMPLTAAATHANGTDASTPPATTNASDKDTAPASQPARSSKAEGALNNASEVNFTDTPLSDVVAFLSDFHQITIKVDPSAAKANDKPISLEAQGSLREVLPKILDPLGLTFSVVEDAVVIKSKAD